MKIISVILAGGHSKRLGLNYKQFLKINGKLLLFYSLDKFAGHSLIDEIIVVVPKEKIDYASRAIKKRYSRPSIKIISGGKTRRHSMYNALKYIKNNKAGEIGFIIFHDAARPLITRNMITKIISAAKKTGSAVYGKKATDLIFKERSSFVKKALNKKDFFCGYTPQCFRFSSIYKAHEKYQNNKSLDDADNTELLLKMNRNEKIKIVEGYYPNIKLTYKPDIKMIKLFLNKI